MTRHRDLLALVAAAVVCAAAALVVPVGWLSLLLLAPLAFFGTGYAILAASFVAAPQPWPRAFWLSVGLSLAVLALLPLPLNYLGGLTPGTWAAALVLVVLVACAVAAWRRPADWSNAGLASFHLPKPAPLTAALGLGAVALVAAAIVLAHVPLANGKAEGFTELWMKAVPARAPTAPRCGSGSATRNSTTPPTRCVPNSSAAANRKRPSLSTPARRPASKSKPTLSRRRQGRPSSR